MNILEIKNICHSYIDKEVLKDISFSIEKGEIVSIIGPSGSGKTTLFNIIAGILKEKSGSIDKKGNKISYMLQKDLLLPFKTVYENISLPLVIQKENKEVIKEKIMPKLKSFGLEGLENCYPSSLSGGQRQRAALLRTYIFSSDIVLLDEPFSALDYITKNMMYDWFLNLKKELNLTCLIITHDIEEAITLSDRIFVLKGNPASIIKTFDVRKGKTDILELKEKIYEVIK